MVRVCLAHPRGRAPARVRSTPVRSSSNPPVGPLPPVPADSARPVRFLVALVRLASTQFVQFDGGRLGLLTDGGDGVVDLTDGDAILTEIESLGELTVDVGGRDVSFADVGVEKGGRA